MRQLPVDLPWDDARRRCYGVLHFLVALSTSSPAPPFEAFVTSLILARVLDRPMGGGSHLAAFQFLLKSRLAQLWVVLCQAMTHAGGGERA